LDNKNSKVAGNNGPGGYGTLLEQSGNYVGINDVTRSNVKADSVLLGSKEGYVVEVGSK
jgi:hypothetical protein